MVAGLYDTVLLDGNGYDQDDIGSGAGLSSIHLYKSSVMLVWNLGRKMILQRSVQFICS
jgi:hypothetical protein